MVATSKPVVRSVLDMFAAPFVEIVRMFEIVELFRFECRAALKGGIFDASHAQATLTAATREAYDAGFSRLSLAPSLLGKCP